MKKRQRDRDSRDEMAWNLSEARELVDAWRASGKKMKEFAEERGVRFTLLRGWAAQLKKSDSASIGVTGRGAAAFVAVDVRQDESVGACVSEIVTPNGLRLVLREHVDLGQLRELLVGLGVASC
jgi:hypothetical protein